MTLPRTTGKARRSRSDESFAQTVARALRIDIDELVECIDQGRIGNALADLFSEPCAATDNGN